MSSQVHSKWRSNEVCRSKAFRLTEFTRRIAFCEVHDKLVTKTIQLFETFMVRFGVMLVGPTLGGKSVDYKTLAIVRSSREERKS